MTDSQILLESTEGEELQLMNSFAHNLKTIFKRIDQNLAHLLRLEKKLQKNEKKIEEHQGKNEKKNKD